VRHSPLQFGIVKKVPVRVLKVQEYASRLLEAANTGEKLR
jgi:hypothetical protein